MALCDQALITADVERVQQSISESSQHALCTGLPMTHEAALRIRRLTRSSVKITEGFSGGAREEPTLFIFMCRFMTCMLFVVAVVLLIFLCSLSLLLCHHLTYTQLMAQADPCRNERGPLATQRNEWLAAVYIHCWNKDTLLGGEVPRETFTVPSFKLHLAHIQQGTFYVIQYTSNMTLPVGFLRI